LLTAAPGQHVIRARNSTAWVKLLVNGLEPIAIDVRVALGGLNAGLL
jgi:hypothetical protein